MMQLAVAIAVNDLALWQDLQSAIRTLPVRIAFEQAGLGDLHAFLDKIERLRPDVVIADLSNLPCELPALVEILAAAPSAPYLVVVHAESKPELILDALRAGAREFLCPPFLPALSTALLRLAGDRERSAPPPKEERGRIAGFLSAKGGCGATTIACHAARLLESETGKATLLCDFDLCSGMVRFLCQAHSRYSVLDALSNVDRLDPSFWRAIVSNGSGHLEVLSAPDAPPIKDAPSPQQIRHVLRFARSAYDWSLLDLGSGLSPLIYAAIEEVNDLFLVTTPDVPALHRVKHIMQQLFAQGFSRGSLHLVLNRVSRRMDVSPSELETILGQEFYATVADYERELREAYAEARLLAAASPLAQDVGRLVARLADLPPKSKKRFSLFG